jgi:ZIP family zinc transporter
MWRLAETPGNGRAIWTRHTRRWLLYEWGGALVNAVVLALLAALGFSGASLAALLGREVRAKGRSYSAAAAAGILLALAFVELFPEALELAGEISMLGFVGGFALLFLVETFGRVHTHYPPEERAGKHTLRPFILGLAIHNLADGFVLGVGAKASAVASGLVGLGILVHQAPVGISLAAVLIAAKATRSQVMRAAILLGLAIPLAAGITVALPVPGDQTLGALTGAAGGVLAYIGAAHLLPEAQAMHPSRITGGVFTVTLVATSIGLIALP